MQELPDIEAQLPDLHWSYPRPTRTAVIDIGSNTTRMVVFAHEGRSLIRVLAESRAQLRLSRRLAASGGFDAETEDLVSDTLADFHAIAKAEGATEVAAIATEAVRNAPNAQETIMRVSQRTGVLMRVVDGSSEAHYSFKGAVGALPVNDGIVIDLGGGSLDLAQFKNRELVAAWSIPFGALAVSDSFLKSDPPRASERKGLVSNARKALSAAGVPRLGRREFLVGVGGSIRNLAKIDRKRRSYAIRRLHGYLLSASAVDEVADRLASLSVKKRAGVPGLTPDRADSLAGGAIVVQTAMRYLRADSMTVSGRGLREGVAMESFTPALPQPDEVRREAVRALCERFGTWDPARALRRQKTLRRLIEATGSDLPGEFAEAALHGAAIIAIGSSVDYYNRLRHACYVVESGDLAGFSHRATALLAAVVREAGKPGVSADGYGPLLDSSDQPGIERAGLLLELATEVERRMPPGEVPADSDVTFNEREVELSVDGLAHWKPGKLGKRFRSVFGKELRVSGRNGP
ncbi:MAG: hypothetical protein ACOC5K_01300 [Chloroflexota bacterium]